MSKEINTVIKNALYLLSTKGLTYIFPLFILGYLVKTLGTASFGQYTIILTVCAYAQVVVDYGFSLTTSRELAKQKENNEVVSTLYFETTILKLVLVILIYPLYYVVCYFYFGESAVFSSSQIGYLFVVGNAFFPIWFFQGIERLGLVSSVNILSKLISFSLIFIFVKGQADVTNALLVQAVPLLTLSVMCNFFVVCKFVNFRNSKVSKKGLLLGIKSGWDVFVSSLSAAFLTNSAVLILGSITTESVVGIYSAAERLAKAVSALFAPITQAVYPYNCRNFSVSIRDGFSSAKKTGIPMIFIAAVTSIAIYISSNFMGGILDLNVESTDILNVFAIWILFGVVNNVLGIQILCASSNARLYSNAFVFCSIISVLMIFLLSYIFSGIGAAIAITCGEIMLTGLLLLSTNKIYKKLS
ncbi:oligosaccharide flippase family protein [Aeromonas veronii]|uniref:oligosaccharide flippase family protein n=1 Tax=Aeromonas veronii TaxID=654 RepID=UPI001FD70F34|nr:oligosaccharide flippase family protein [Aeromonas veronii]MCJ8217233.1 oligosaccharide flippase family protein [Aeromonas veronii]